MSKRQPAQQYYNINKLLSKNAIYNIIIGERSNGKTYAVLKYAVEKYFKDKSQFAILRRWQEDITGHRAGQMFTNLIANGEIMRISKGEYTGITYYARKFYFCNYDEKGNLAKIQKMAFSPTASRCPKWSTTRVFRSRM